MARRVGNVHARVFRYASRVSGENVRIVQRWKWGVCGGGER